MRQAVALPVLELAFLDNIGHLRHHLSVSLSKAVLQMLLGINMLNAQIMHIMCIQPSHKSCAALLPFASSV